jgi:hypothetical protein
LNVNRFWEIHSNIKGDKSYYDQDFKDLFEMMTREDVDIRASLKDIKESKWFSKEIYEPKEFKILMKQYLSSS